MNQPFEIGDVLARSLRIALGNILPFGLIVAVTLLPVLALGLVQNSLLGTPTPDDPFGAFTPAWAVLTLVGALLSVILVFTVSGAISYGVFHELGGERKTLGDCVSTGFRRMLPVVGVALSVAIVSYLGLFLLIVPGVILYMMFSVAVPAAVLERTGVRASMRRSRALTADYRLAILGVFVLMFLINLVISVPVFAVSALGNQLLSIVLQWIVQIFGTILQATAMTVTYHRLREVKEAFDVQQLAEVFD